jgi:hypothetical protein
MNTYKEQSCSQVGHFSSQKINKEINPAITNKNGQSGDVGYNRIWLHFKLTVGFLRFCY